MPSQTQFSPIPNILDYFHVNSHAIIFIYILKSTYDKEIKIQTEVIRMSTIINLT